jgi:lysophospholipase L1-like esterase
VFAKIIKYSLLNFLFQFSAYAQIQVAVAPDIYLMPEPDTISLNFPFICQDSIAFKNEKSLTEFFFKLHHNKEQINILHIGDSHVQAGVFPGTVRQELQKKFGNAGYGHFFPYGVANTNGPIEIQSFSQGGSWLSFRSTKYTSLPIKFGLSGHTLQTYSSLAGIKIRLNSNFYFDEIYVFHSKTAYDFKVKLVDNLGVQIGNISMDPEESNSNTVSSYQTVVPITEFIIKPVRTDNSQKKFTLYGLSCRNTKERGIVYHSIGINGAEYRHYNGAEYFFEHTKKLKPDLIIVSLGTNEAYNYASFNKATFYTYVDVFVKKIKEQNPDAALLITTPGESYRRVGKKSENNPYILDVREVLINYCTEKNIALWDWYNVMGGSESIDKWSAANLTDRYKIHYTAKGYRMQGHFLYKALMKAYQNTIPK